MKTLLKFAVGAAIAGALVNLLMKQRSGTTYPERVAAGAAGSGEDAIADTNSVGNSDDAQGSQPQDWRGAQNVLDS
jgi:hypothetical protein